MDSPPCLTTLTSNSVSFRKYDDVYFSVRHNPSTQTVFRVNLERSISKLFSKNQAGVLIPFVSICNILLLISSNIFCKDPYHLILLYSVVTADFSLNHSTA